MSRRLDREEVARQLGALPGWAGDPERIARSYGFPDFPTTIRAVDEIAVVAEAMDHHPDLDVRWRTLTVACTTHDADGVTQLDVELAHRVHEIAAALGGA